MSIITEVTNAYWRLGGTGPIQPIPSVFALEWTIKREASVDPLKLPRRVWASGVEIAGSIFTTDADIATVLADLTPYGHDANVEATPFLSVQYRSKDPATRMRTFARVIFCAKGGAKMNSIPTKKWDSKIPVHEISFMVAILESALVSTYTWDEDV